MNGDEQVGSSLFRLSAGVDDGEIFHQWRLPLTARASIGEVLAELETQITKGISQLWGGIIEGSLSGTPQDETQASFSAQRRPEDGCIDWPKSASAPS